MKSFREILESKTNYKVYHKSYTEAIQTSLDQIKKNGYEYSEEEYFQRVTTGDKKPGRGMTNKITLGLFKSGKEQRKAAHIQIYRMDDDNFELNFYIN